MIVRALAVTAAILGTSVAGVAQEDPVICTVRTDKARYFVGERIQVRIELSIETAFRSEKMVQLFPRKLDLPVQVLADWWKTTGDFRRIRALRPAAPRTLRLVLGDDIHEAAQVESQNGRERFVLDGTFVADRAGVHTEDPVTVRYAYGTSFREDFLNGRVAEDRKDASAKSNSVSFEVMRVPTRGRPEGFTGAVGTFVLEARCVDDAEAPVRELDAGQTFTLVVRITGRGNLHEFAVPRLDLEGYRSRGHLETKTNRDDVRELRYELVALGGVERVQPVTLHSFDPQSETFVAARSAPVPLTVRGRLVIETPADPPPRPPEHDDVVFEELIFGLGIAVLLVSGLITTWVLRRGKRRSRATSTLGARELDAFRTAARDDDAVVDAFDGLLAGLLGATVGSLAEPGLNDRLARIVPKPLADRGAALRDSLASARYSGRVSPAAVEGARAWVDEVAEHLSP